MADQKHGKRFEKDVQACLDRLKETGMLAYVRLYDTRSAGGNYIPAQPGDFIVSAGGFGHLIEVKASLEHDSLKTGLSSLVPIEQAASHRLWQKSGSPSWFLFKSMASRKIELWDGEHVGEARAGLCKLGSPEAVSEDKYILKFIQALFLGDIDDHLQAIVENTH